MNQVEKDVIELRQKIGSTVVRKAGSGVTGSSNVPTVLSLPAIPTRGMKEVFWTSAGAGDGDDQIWRAYAGQSEWTPTQLLTSLSGTP